MLLIKIFQMFDEKSSWINKNMLKYSKTLLSEYIKLMRLKFWANKLYKL